MSSINLRPKLKDVVAFQLPEFIREQYPAFVQFVEAYYEFLDKNSVDLTQIRDIDTTLDDFIQYFKAELAHNYPVNSDKDTDRYLLKHIKDQYLAKGSEASYKLLFRLLYGKDVYMDYPGKSMLRVSDGRWTQDVSVFVRVDLGTAINLIGKTVDVQTSKKIYRTTQLAGGVTKVTANIENVLPFAGDIYEIFLDRNFYGEIIPGDVIKYKSEFQGQVLPVSAKVKVQNRGAGFSPGQVFQVSSGDGTSIWFKVLSTTTYTNDKGVSFDGGLKTIDVIKFGLGYNTDFSITVLPTSAVSARKKITKTPVAITYSLVPDVVGKAEVISGGAGYLVPPQVVIGGNGAGATGHAVIEDGVVKRIVIDSQGLGYTTAFVNIIPQVGDPGDGATAEITLGTNYLYEYKDTTSGFSESGYLNYGDYWDVTEHGRGALATATVNNDVITGFTIVNQGSGYTTATVEVTDPTGSGLEATPIISAGKITGFTITSYGYGYTDPTIVIDGDGVNAEATAIIKDGCITSINLTEGGSGYDIASPVIDILCPVDINGNVIDNGVGAKGKAVVNSSGVITSISVTAPGEGYILPPTVAAPKVYVRGSFGYADGAYVGTIARQFFVDSKDTVTGNPALLNVELGALAKYPGYYKTNDGFLSDSMFIQDSYYYQAFSYVIRIDEQLQKYASVVRTMLHPSGMAMFGEYSINNNIPLSVALTSLVKSLGVTLYDEVFAIEYLTHKTSKDVSDANIFPVDALDHLDFVKAANDSVTMIDPSEEYKTYFVKAVGFTGQFEHVFLIDDGGFRDVEKVFEDTLSLQEIYARLLTTKVFTDYQPTDDSTWGLDFTLNTIDDPLPGVYPEEGYLVLGDESAGTAPFEMGGYFSEIYVNGRNSTF
jgi:hypothetical protein